MDECRKDIERKTITYQRIEDKANSVLVQYELSTGTEVEEKLSEMKELWNHLTHSYQELKYIEDFFLSLTLYFFLFFCLSPSLVFYLFVAGVASA